MSKVPGIKVLSESGRCGIESKPKIIRLLLYEECRSLQSTSAFFGVKMVVKLWTKHRPYWSLPSLTAVTVQAQFRLYNNADELRKK